MYFRCPKCSKTFPTKKARIGHIGGAHSKAGKSQKSLEDQLLQKKKALVMKQMNDMMKAEPTCKVDAKFGKIEVACKDGKSLSISVSPDAVLNLHGSFTGFEYKGPEAK